MKDRNEALSSYVSDMLSLEEHIAKAIRSQVEDLKDHPAVTAELRSILGTIDNHADALKGVLDGRGGNGATAIKRAGSTLLGWAAGAIDLVRSEGLPKNLRDDYTASSLAAIGYVMLYTTARSLEEPAVADVALRHLRDYARVVMLLHNVIPGAVIQFLQEEGLPATDAHLPEIARELETLWQEVGESVPEADEVPAPGGRR
ncbi:MAG TPA: DUF892 family protein [Gemmatimonadota bacterium]|jgi:hypothetical protein